MSIEIVIPSSAPAYLPGARLLAILAYPPKSPSDHNWRRAERVLCRSVLLGKQQLDPDWAQREQTLVPEHLMLPVAGIQRKLEAIANRHHHRLGAAHVAMPYFQNAARAPGVAQKSNRRHSTIDARIQKTNEQEADREDWLTAREVAFKPRFPKDDHNFERRVFRPSLPVLPLAVAVAVWIDRSQKFFRANPNLVETTIREDSGGPQLHVGHLLVAPDFARQIVADAMAFEPLMPTLPRSGAVQIVRLRLE